MHNFFLKAAKKSKHPFFANSFYLYLSHFSDYLLALFFLPYIAKSIGTIEFGKIGLAQTFGVFIILFMEFGSPLMATRKIARIKNNSDSVKIFINDILSFKLLLIPIIFILAALLAAFVPINLNYFLIVILGSIFQGISPSWYFLGLEKMKKVAISKISFRLIGFILIFVFVNTPDQAWVVLFSYSFTSALICFYLFFEMKKNIGSFKFKISNRSIKILNKSKYSFLITIVPIIYQNISIIIISFFISPIQLGFYYGANKIYRAFNTLYGPMGQAFYPQISASNLGKKYNSKISIKFYFILIFTVGVVFFLIISFFSKTLIFYLLGIDYMPANNILKFSGIVLPLTAISNALGRQWLMSINKDLYYAITQIVASLVGLFSFISFINVGPISIPISLIFFELTTIIMILFFSFIKKNDQ